MIYTVIENTLTIFIGDRYIRKHHFKNLWHFLLQESKSEIKEVEIEKAKIWKGKKRRQSKRTKVDEQSQNQNQNQKEEKETGLEVMGWI